MVGKDANEPTWTEMVDAIRDALTDGLSGTQAILGETPGEGDKSVSPQPTTLSDILSAKLDHVLDLAKGLGESIAKIQARF